MIKDTDVNLKLSLQRIELGIESNPSYPKVEVYTKFIEAELQGLAYSAAGQTGTTTPNKAKVLNDKTQPPPKADIERRKGEKGAGKGVDMDFNMEGAMQVF